jgi:hypothetical protein
MERQGERDTSDQGREVSPAWHRAELRQRRAQVLRGTAHFQRWDDAMAALRTELREQRVH